ncbi:chromosomal replication initiator protein [Roseibium hamelinense]|uniref:Chromosomal replication initiator protein DnaA n=1 Tax=Roseibium hamelinense TaxID=150831 RepID=A0A562SVI4_9HYPH|nr:chromosomal replication initiator protein DnaA [Roseibium hamelinense]MTI42414.1 chromosomal replication initiator protein DnaA [Roseibium hamelinense]TWI84700.1 chromosomal replication initiator protein [Roseibium hamelinense]
MQLQRSTGSDRWDRVKTKLRAELGDDAFFNWFGRVNLEENDGATVKLSVPTRFLKNWIQSNYNDRLVGLWQRECGNVDRIELVVRGALRPRPNFCAGPVFGSHSIPGEHANANRPHQTIATLRSGLRRASATDIAKNAAADLVQGAPLNSKFTFDTFVEGNSNGLAYSAAQEIARNDASELDVLFVRGGVGSGKTHLLQAAAAAARARGKKVMYLTAEYFMYQFVPALRTRMFNAIRSSLDTLDVLLIDDIQLLHGKQLPQDFQKTVEMLLAAPARIIVASDREPSDLVTVSSELVEKLSGGLTASIQPADFDLRKEILQARLRAAQRHYPSFELPDAVVNYIARFVVSSGRDLEGAMNRLLAQSQLTKQAVTLDIAEKTLHDLVGTLETRSVKIEDIQQTVCKHYHVARADLLSSWRARTIVKPRQIAMYLSKVMTSRSLPEIGRRFGNRDHTTVLHAVRKVEKQIKTDKGLQQEVELLKRLVHP